MAEVLAFRANITGIHVPADARTRVMWLIGLSPGRIADFFIGPMIREFIAKFVGLKIIFYGEQNKNYL